MISGVVAELIFSVEPTPWSNEPKPEIAPVVVIVELLVSADPVATVSKVPALIIPSLFKAPLIVREVAEVNVPLFV